MPTWWLWSNRSAFERAYLHEQTMSTPAQWEPDFCTGHEVIDTEHRNLLNQCNLLADCCQAEDGGASDRRFDAAFDRLRTLAREHFETEASLLSSRGYPDLEGHRTECDEFEYLADEIVTTENFDRPELQRFLTLWWIGHITASARTHRDYLADRHLDPGQ